ncbi:unnamed protein product, partial [marine sediment metagenome]
LGKLEEIKSDAINSVATSDLISHDNLTSQGNPVIEYEFRNKIYRSNYKPPPQSLDRLVRAGRILALGNTLRYLRILSDYPYYEINQYWGDLAISGFADPKVYVVQTATRVIERCILMTTDPGDLV